MSNVFAGLMQEPDPHSFTRYRTIGEIPNSVVAKEYARVNRLGISWIVQMTRYGFKDFTTGSTVLEAIHGVTNYRCLYRVMKEYVRNNPNRGSIQMSYDELKSTLSEDHRRIVDGAIVEAVRKAKLNLNAYLVDLGSLFGMRFRGTAIVFASSPEEAAELVNREAAPSNLLKLCAAEHCEPVDATQPQAIVIEG